MAKMLGGYSECQNQALAAAFAYMNLIENWGSGMKRVVGELKAAGLKENENPSIGIILCREANRIVVEYAMSRAMSPVMVAQYKKMLIPKEVLQRTFEESLALPQLSAKRS